MTCDEYRKLLSAYVDGEVERGPVDEHLKDCPECRAQLESLQALSSSVKRAPRYQTNADQRERFLSSISAKQTTFHWRSFSVGAACVALAWVAITYFPFNRPAFGEAMVQEHILAIGSNHLFDVASSDRHTVKPWFAGKVSVAPKVEDYKAAGFELIGGRIETLNGTKVPVMVYRHGAHVIDVFAFPAGDKQELPKTIRGFQLVTWQVEDVRYVAISDTDRAELDLLFRLMTTPSRVN